MVALRLSVAVAPLLASLVFGWPTVEGYAGFGGGEEDIFLVVPPLLWSLLYLWCYLVLWAQGFRFRHLGVGVRGFATGLTAPGWVVLYLFSRILPG